MDQFTIKNLDPELSGIQTLKKHILYRFLPDMGQHENGTWRRVQIFEDAAHGQCTDADHWQLIDHDDVGIRCDRALRHDSHLPSDYTRWAYAEKEEYK